MKNLYFLVICLTAIVSFNLDAQDYPDIPSAERSTNELWSGLEWRLVGPFRGGRAGTVTGVPHDRNLYYMGTAGGGVWKTTDAGNTWSCISDGYFGGSIGSVAVADADPNVIYVGEGEQTVRGNVSSGWGMWKSTDAGKSWKHLGLMGSEHIARIRVHPDDANVVYVAAMGNLWKPNPERGVFRSTDGGETWEKILFESDSAGAVDIAFDPNNPRIIYASTWQIKRNGYRMDSGGPGSKLWKSTDGGNNWTDLSKNEGLPEGVWGISGVTVSPVNSSRVWAIIEHAKGGVFRSDDAGVTWKKTNENRALRQRAWYYSRIYADSQNEDMVYVMNVRYHRSKDGGKTFESFNAPHGDHHDLWIDPNDNTRMAIADDGGAQVSIDGGANWTTYHNQPTAQFYRVTTDNHFPFRILGAQQDNSTVRILHRSASNRINESHWDRTAGGESAHLAADPDDPEIVYGGTYKGYMMRRDHHTDQTRSINVWPFNPAGSGVEVMKYRFNWNFPIFFSPHDNDKLYACSNQLHVSTNEGQSWEVISPDLTRNDPKTLKSSGGPITQDNTGVEFYGTIFAACESPTEEGLLWTASDDGLVHMRNGASADWKDVTPAAAPDNIMWNCIDVHPEKAGVAYIAGTAYKFGDYTPYLFKTSNYGKNWTNITNGIHNDHYTRAIRADHRRDGLLYAGTEWGIYVSFDDGANWESLQLNLPIVSIRDLHVRENMLVAATHGRSFWMIDDLTPLQEWSADIAGKSHHLFSTKPAFRLGQSGGNGEASLLEGGNHPNGVLFHFFIKDVDEADDWKLEILDAENEVIRTFSTKAKEKKDKLLIEDGGNRFVWDMRYDGFKEFPGMILYSSPNRGPKALPGDYSARLVLNEDKIAEVEMRIEADPRMPNTYDDYKAQFDFLISVRDKVSQAHEAIIDIRDTKKDIDYVKGKLDVNKHQDIIDALDAITEALEVSENNIHETRNKSYQDPLNFGIKVNNHLAFLMQDAQRGDYPPTDQAKALFIELSQTLDGYLAELEETKNKLSGLNSQIQEAGVGFFSVPVGRP